MDTALLSDLERRGLIAQSTDIYSLKVVLSSHEGALCKPYSCVT